MKTKVKLFIISCFLLSFTSQSMAGGPKIWIEHDLSEGEQVTNGREKEKMGFLGGFDVTELVKDNPTALALAEKRSQFNTYAKLSYWLGAIPSSIMLGVGAGLRDNLTMGISTFSFLGTLILTVHFNSQARHYMYEAINTYNGVTRPSSENSPDSPRSQATPYSAPLASNSNSIGFSFRF